MRLVSPCLLLSLAACSPEAVRRKPPSGAERALREAFVEEHPELPRQVKNDLLSFKTSPEDVLRRLDYVERHPATSRRGQAVRSAILTGSVRGGMTGDQVRASWGEPDRVTPNPATGGREETWYYYRKQQPTQSRRPLDQIILTDGVVTALRRNLEE